MKKLFFIGLVVLGLLSCKKENNKNGCWICETQGMVGGVNWDGKHKEVCNGSTTDQPQVVDENGNNIGSPNGCKKEF